jgi:prolyl-tRNA synthetase
LRLSRLFGRTLREAPGFAEANAHRLALRAGLMRSLAPGAHAYLPLGRQAVLRLAGLVRAEWERLGGQEMALPLIQPVDLLERSGRYAVLRAGLVRYRDDAQRELAAGATGEEPILGLAGPEIGSHHQLPVFLFEMTHVLSRQASRRGWPGWGASHVARGFTLHGDPGDMEKFYALALSAIDAIFERCEVRPVRALASPGASSAHHWLLPQPSGQDAIVRCSRCEYAAIPLAAGSAQPEQEQKDELPLEELATPGAETIAALAQFLGVPTHRTLKVVFYTVRGRVICVAIRGDRAVDEEKLARVLGEPDFSPSTEAELAAAGTVPGYGSPIGLQGVRVVADRTVAAARNLAAGANKAGYHVRNVNTPRDFEIDLVADLARVQEGDPCPRCAGTLSLTPGIRLAQAEMMGTELAEVLGVTYLGADGRARPLALASYSIGLDHLLAAVLETHHDDQGIVWPLACAPLQVHVAGLNLNKPEVAEKAEALYRELLAEGVSVLYDDRDASAGVKFADADLIGLPLRLTISARSLDQGGVEVKWRSEADRAIVSLADLPAVLRNVKRPGETVAGD